MSYPSNAKSDPLIGITAVSVRQSSYRLVEPLTIPLSIFNISPGETDGCFAPLLSSPQECPDSVAERPEDLHQRRSAAILSRALTILLATRPHENEALTETSTGEDGGASIASFRRDSQEISQPQRLKKRANKPRKRQ
jgi:hypothetical protein